MVRKHPLNPKPALRFSKIMLEQAGQDQVPLTSVTLTREWPMKGTMILVAGTLAFSGAAFAAENPSGTGTATGMGGTATGVGSALSESKASEAAGLPTGTQKSGPAGAAATGPGTDEAGSGASSTGAAGAAGSAGSGSNTVR